MADVSKIQDRKLPQPPGGLPQTLYVFLRELVASMAAFIRDVSVLQNAGKQTIVQLDVLENEPSDTTDGMIVFADGTLWNPGSGRGVYERRSSNWVKL